MKLSKETLDILNNFKLLNRGLVVKQGSLIKTRHQQTQMPIAEVELPEVFPRDFAISELHSFLSVFNLLDDPELEFTDSHIVMTDNSKRVAKIKYAQPSMVVHMDYDLKIQMPSEDVILSLSESNFKSILKASSSFNSPEIAFINDGESINISTYNSNNTGADTFSIFLSNVHVPEKFKIILNVDYLQLLLRDYDVTICYKGLLQFTSKTEHSKLTYWIAASEKSKVT